MGGIVYKMYENQNEWMKREKFVTVRKKNGGNMNKTTRCKRMFSRWNKSLLGGQKKKKMKNRKKNMEINEEKKMREKIFFLSSEIRRMVKWNKTVKITKRIDYK